MIDIFTFLKLKINQIGKDKWYNEHGYWSCFLKNGAGEINPTIWIAWPNGFRPKKYRKFK